MKVFFVNTNQAWGGGEKWHFETASMLKRHGHNVAILTGIKTQLFKQSDDAGIKTIPVIIGNLSFLNPFRVHKLKQLFKSEKPDILILNLSADLKTAGIAAVLADIKHIIYRRGNAKPVKNSATNRILFRKIVTGIIANSEETKRSLLKNNSELFPADCIKVLYNGIDLKQFYNQEYTPLIEKKKGTVILGSAGRLSNEKGQQYLIELAILLKKQKLEFKLLIAGDGSMKESLLEKCRKSGLESNVIFSGFVKNIKSFMETIDIFILPSLWEGFGYVTIEAMASEKPVVAFHTGSNPEIIDDGKTGFLVSCYNMVELAERVNILIADPGLRQKFGKAGRERVERIFNSELTDRAIIQHLEGLK